MKPSNRRNFLTTTSSAAAGLSMLTATNRVLGREKKSKIKIGQIGTGHAHARSVFSQLKRVTEDFELVGIVENDPQRRKELGDSFQDVKLISEEQLFYLEQRGISRENAITLVINGFCKEVFKQLPMEFAVEAQRLLTLKLENSVG